MTGPPPEVVRRAGEKTSARVCASPGCEVLLISAFPVCGSHWFDIEAVVREEYFDALTARDGTKAAEDRFEKALAAVIESAAEGPREPARYYGQ